MAAVNTHPSPSGAPRPDDGAPPSGAPSPDGVVGFSEAMVPLVGLAVEHGLDLMGRGEDLEPTVLAITADGMRGMWTDPQLTPQDAAGFVAKIDPRPARAVAVFHGGVQLEEGLVPAYFLESFEAGTPSSVRMIVRHSVGNPEAGEAPAMLGEPTLVGNGPNPLA